ncbi:uncharacterized protein LOC108596709 isoform X2 [Drosophila busckii]|uniref:uncharacterized protein LOC108596709 isoform X2 n=1 Tax=Drosophila busckii TaxID=30019 RepID=UPI00083EA1DF|nr:uncharacterized protein LOC108596709 isoform X2 [Drosophila busckii]
MHIKVHLFAWAFAFLWLAALALAQYSAANMLYNVGESSSLNCSAKVFNVEWWQPTGRSAYNYKNKSAIIIPMNPPQNYERELEMLLQQEQATKIYVYVNDPNQLLAPFEGKLPVELGELAYIPCKPSYPNVEVTLSYGNKTRSSRNFKNYSEQRGFPMRIRNFTTKYTCRPKQPSPNNPEEAVLIELLNLALPPAVKSPLPTWVWLSVAIALVLLLALIVLFAICYYVKRKQQRELNVGCIVSYK